MESFEITFFGLKQEYDKRIENIFDVMLEKHDAFNKACIIEHFKKKDKDYIEIRLSIFDLVITEDSLSDIFRRL